MEHSMINMSKLFFISQPPFSPHVFLHLLSKIVSIITFLATIFFKIPTFFSKYATVLILLSRFIEQN